MPTSGFWFRDILLEPDLVLVILPLEQYVLRQLFYGALQGLQTSCSYKATLFAQPFAQLETFNCDKMRGKVR